MSLKMNRITGNEPSKLDRRSLLKLASSGFIFMLGSQLACGSGATADDQSAFESSDALKSLANKLGKLQLDGAFVFDTQACKDIAVDFGHYIHNAPLGILKPASASDVQKLLKFATQHNVQVVMRGTGGAAYGQTQIKNGIVVDSSTLVDMQWNGDDYVDLGPGCIWVDVVTFTNTKQKTPPVLPDTMVMSVGGTMSAGGIGETSYRLGPQVAHVVELDVVTAAGDLVTCSKTCSPDLFNAALSGMGQCGIITRTRMHVIDSPATVYTREYKYAGTDYATYLDDLAMFAKAEDQGAIGGHITRDASGTTWTYVLDITYWSSDKPAWLANIRGTTDGNVKTWSFFDYANRNTQSWKDAVTSGAAVLPHPYIAWFVPKDNAGTMIQAILDSPSANLGAGKIALFPMINANFADTPQVMPDGTESCHMRIYRVVKDGEGGPNHLAMLDSNKNEVLPMIFANQGKVYLPFSPLLTRQQRNDFYGSRLKAFKAAKDQYDPSGILGKSANIF